MVFCTKRFKLVLNHVLKLYNVLIDLTLDSGFQKHLVKRFREDASACSWRFSFVAVHYATITESQFSSDRTVTVGIFFENIKYFIAFLHYW